MELRNKKSIRNILKIFFVTVIIFGLFSTVIASSTYAWFSFNNNINGIGSNASQIKLNNLDIKMYKYQFDILYDDVFDYTNGQVISFLNSYNGLDVVGPSIKDIKMNIYDPVLSSLESDLDQKTNLIFVFDFDITYYSSFKFMFDISKNNKSLKESEMLLSDYVEFCVFDYNIFNFNDNTLTDAIFYDTVNKYIKNNETTIEKNKFYDETGTKSVINLKNEDVIFDNTTQNKKMKFILNIDYDKVKIDELFKTLDIYNRYTLINDYLFNFYGVQI